MTNEPPADHPPEDANRPPQVEYGPPERLSPKLPFAIAALTCAGIGFLASLVSIFLHLAAVGRLAPMLSGGIAVIIAALYVCSVVLLFYSDAPTPRNVLDSKTNMLCLITFLVLLAGSLTCGCPFALPFF